MRRSLLAYAFLLTFIATIFALRWWQQASYPLGLWWGLSGAGAVLGAFRATAARVSTAALLGCSLAFACVSRTTHVPTPTSIDTYTGDFRMLEGIVCKAPDARETYTYYTLCAERLIVPEIGEISGTVLVRKKEEGGAAFAYGDRLRVAGSLRSPPWVPGFDYGAYLSLSDVYAIAYASSIERLGTGHGNGIFTTLFSWRSRYERHIESLLPQPQASFLEGLLTGSRRGLPDDLTDDFNATGLTHIVAVSGFNITIVLTVIQSLLFWLPLRWRFLPATVAIAAFTVFTGASASVVRAGIMGFLGLLATQTGRRGTMRLSILWTAALMLAFNPKRLWFDASFQLSFLSVIGIAELQPIIGRMCRLFPEALGIRDSMQVTLSAQCSTLAWIAHTFGRISIIAPLSNLLVVPLIPHAMLLGFVATLSTLVPGTEWIRLSCESLLTLILVIIQRCADIPFASLPVRLSAGWTTVSYALLIGIIAMREFRTRTRAPSSDDDQRAHAPPAWVKRQET